ncbi:uncharacterized protein PgNI_11625 [Pyricularia grisea]|uniref:CN hydrolase domain-containing protein n=1 Tax=Pyricularia grisea TaxID=148305 RepID=A0A6P8AP27_PYRGI|nr:uncharacterized protein PgNI_11625 [Pyricularia grisea]TLD03799.1 hypothetical protein PgNI_11625 [Pyricularia grisea]
MRIGCLQFSPQMAAIDDNLNRADAVLNRANPDDLEDLDILVLPAMAFTGQNFLSLRDISPFLEPVGLGISALWARTTALKYNCKIAIGYPEKADSLSSFLFQGAFFNSLLMVNENGETLANYKKQHLDYADKRWAFERAGGFFHDVIDGLGRVTMGVYTNIDPSETLWYQFEFVFNILDFKANVVIVSMAWSASVFDNPASFYSKPDEPHMATLEHWVKRMEPLIRADRDDEIIFVFANRYGNEGDVLYTGFLAVIGICNGKLFVIDTDKEPLARFVRRSGKKATDDSCDIVGDDLFGPVRTIEELAILYSSRNIYPTNEIDTRELTLIYIPENTVEIFTNTSTNIRPKSPKKTRHLACVQTQMPISNRSYYFDFAMRKPATGNAFVQTITTLITVEITIAATNGLALDDTVSISEEPFALEAVAPDGNAGKRSADDKPFVSLDIDMKKLFNRGLAFADFVWGVMGGSVESVENVAVVAVDVLAAVVFKLPNPGLGGVKSFGPFTEGIGSSGIIIAVYSFI